MTLGEIKPQKLPNRREGRLKTELGDKGRLLAEGEGIKDHLGGGGARAGGLNTGDHL